jgi:hypothetical protein
MTNVNKENELVEDTMLEDEKLVFEEQFGDDKDKCVLCNDDSIYDMSEPINKRIGYIEGSGQMCLECYDKVYNHDISRTLEDIYEMKDLYGVGKVKWNAIKHLTPIEFQKSFHPDVTKNQKKPGLMGSITYASTLYPIHRDKLCSDCMWCEIDDECPLDDWTFDDEYEY